MAVLTWRNVDAPSDRGNSAITGMAAAARLFDNGASGLGDAIGNFGKSQTDLANNAVVQAASRFQSSDQLKAALSDGSLFAGLQGVDPTRVDARTTGLVTSRVGDLLDNSTKDLNNQTLSQQMSVRGEKLLEDQYAFGRTKDQNVNTDAARAAYGEYLSALNSGDRTGAAVVWDNNRDILSKLTPEQQNELLKGGQNLNQGRLTADSTSLGNETTSFNNMVTQRNDRAQQGALQVMDSLKDAGNGSEAYQQYNRISQSLDPQVAATVRSQLEQRWGPIFGGNSGVGSFPGSGGTGAPGAIAGAVGGVSALGGAPLELGDPGTFNGGKYDVTFGGRKTDVPITSMSIGDLTKKNGLMDQMINDPTLQNSPLGAYQINKDTMLDFAKRLNIDPNTKFTPDVQEQMAEAIFNDRKNGVLGKTWEGLKTKNVPGAMDKGAFKDKSWAEMKDLISQTEGTAGAQTAQEVRNDGKILLDSLTNLKTNQGQKILLNQSNGVEKALAVTRTGSDPGGEANNLIASNPAFKGADAGWLTDEIAAVAKRGKMTPPQAAALIQQHLKSNQGTLANVADKFRTLGGLTDGFTGTDASPNLPSGQRINDRALWEAADSNSQGQGVAQLGQTQGMVATQAQIDQASAALQQAQEQLINARQKKIANPRWAGFDAVQQQYNQTVAQARLLLASASNNSSVNLVPGYNDQAARRAAATVR